MQEIFNEVIRINTLDAKLYEQVQQTMIDALDQETSVGSKERRESDRYACRTVPAERPGKETIFENCVADVNIPVGEVFTSHRYWTGQTEYLNVSKVYLDGLQYRNLKLTFKDGKITDYRCDNFQTKLREPEIYL